MIGILLAVPVCLLLMILQTTIVSTLPLLNGTADLFLLVLASWAVQERVRSSFEWAAVAGVLVGIVSHSPLLVPLAGYLGVAAFARLLRASIWQSPLVAFLLTAFFGSLLLPVLTWGALQFEGVSLPIIESFNRVILPGFLLNLLLAIPVYTVIADLAHAVYPEEVAE